MPFRAKRRQHEYHPNWQYGVHGRGDCGGVCTSVNYRLRGILIVGLILISIILTEAKRDDDNKLYKLLGVSKSASMGEIKKAYRKKALLSHPDKNKHVPAAQAAEEFQKVVHAFEVLSDKGTRQRYDRTGQAGSATATGSGGHSGGRGGAGSFTWTFRWSNNGGTYQRQQRPQLKDRFDVKEAQSRILHIVSLAQLETIITTETDENNTTGPVLERNLVVCFYTPPLETQVMDKMVYPWPFAAMSAQGIWWEDLLQTTVVRYHNSNDLTKLFHIPEGQQLQQPIFVFVKRGTRFQDVQMARTVIQTDDRTVFDQWMWNQLTVEITFTNQHSHMVELYWINQQRASLKHKIEPKDTVRLNTILSHEWWVRDGRTDTRKDAPRGHRLTEETCLYNIKITNDLRTNYIIPKRTCFNLSGHCAYWNQRGNYQECDRNPIFMHEICPVTCKLCTKHNNDDEETEEEEAVQETQQPKPKLEEKHDEQQQHTNRHDGDEL